MPADITWSQGDLRISIGDTDIPLTVHQEQALAQDPDVFDNVIRPLAHGHGIALGDCHSEDSGRATDGSLYYNGVWETAPLEGPQQPL